MVKEIIKAKSFAVVGASDDGRKVGHIVFKNLFDKRVKVYPVNNKGGEVLGEKCFKNLREINEKVDCVIVAIPSKFVLEVLKEAGENKIKNIVIISAGFSESGDGELSEEVEKVAKKYDLKIVGPNTLGFINPYTNVNASFFDGRIVKGDVAFLSQSGAIGVGVLDKGVGLSGFVSLGNSLINDVSDFIEYYGKDENTKKIAVYLESLGVGCGKRFIDVCKKCEKPIYILKAGKSSEGQKAASSHTAALASEKGIYEGVFKQCGIKEVDSISELFGFNFERVEGDFKVKGNRSLIITNAGGLGVLVSDYCSENGIEISDLPSDIKVELGKVLPRAWSKGNPIDVLGDAQADRFEKSFEILEKGDFFDFYIVLLTPQYMTEPEKTAEILLDLKKPVVACFLGGEKVVSAFGVLKGKIPVFKEPKEMCEWVGRKIIL